MICQAEEPDLVGVPDVQDTFEVERAGGFTDLGGGGESNLAPGCGTIGIQRQHKTGIGERVVLKRQVGKRRIAAEIGVTALVDGQGCDDIGFQVRYKEVEFDVGPECAGVGEFSALQAGQCFFAGRGGR